VTERKSSGACGWRTTHSSRRDPVSSGKKQRRLKFKSDGFMGKPWSNWSKVVHDSAGVEVFSFAMSGVANGK
jgi:hypothetical protein